MLMLIAGLALFLGVHSSRVFAEDTRSAFIAAHGEKAWNGLYAVLSIVGFVLVVYGYGEARTAPLVLWTPPGWTRHAAALLTLPAFILLVAAYVPRNAIKARLGHPMLLGTKLWAAAHLLANGNVADVLLFGGFLIWATLCFRAAKGRDRAAGTVYPSGGATPTLIAIAVGIAAWAAFAFHLHLAWIGVRPFG